MGLSTTFTLKFDGQAVKKGLKGIGTSIKSLGSAAMGIAKAGAAVVAFGVGAAAGIAAVALKLNNIGEAANTSEARLKNIIDSMDLFGDKSGEVADRLNDLADAQGRMIGEDNKIIRLTQSKLMTFKELAMTADAVGGAFDRATMAALDMAAAGFGTAEMNAVQLGKALNDPIKGINSLTRSGITFTAAEKEKIKALVESNQMLKAQDIILKAIETQIGGTSRATADGSKKMVESASQILQAFSKPFSEGFNSIPGMLENVFPKIKAKAEEMGGIFSIAIQDAIAGDYEQFAMIGEIIGDAIMVGIKTAWQKGSSELIKGFLKMGSGDTDFDKWLNKKIDDSFSLDTKDLIKGNLIDSGIQDKYQALKRNPSASESGQIPKATQRIYSNGMNATDENGRIIRVLESIDRRLSPQP